MPHKVVLDSELLTQEGCQFQASTLPLYKPNTLTPEPNDVRQGRIGCCYLNASLHAIVHSSPKLIESFFIDETTTHCTVRFYSHHDGVTDSYDYTLEKSLLCDAQSHPLQAHKNLWPHMLEKAFAVHARHTQQDQTYRKRLTGGSAEEVFNCFYGQASGFNIDGVTCALKLLFLQALIKKECQSPSELEDRLNQAGQCNTPWLNRVTTFSQAADKLSSQEKKYVYQLIHEDSSILELDESGTAERHCRLSDNIKQTLSIYQDAQRVLWIQCLSKLTDKNNLCIIGTKPSCQPSGDIRAKHGYTLLGFEQNHDMPIVHLRDPSGLTKNGNRALALNEFIKIADTITYCRPSHIAAPQHRAKKLTLYKQEASAKKFIANIVDTLRQTQAISRQEWQKVTTELGHALANMELLQELPLDRLAQLDSILSRLIREHTHPIFKPLSFFGYTPTYYIDTNFDIASHIEYHLNSDSLTLYRKPMLANHYVSQLIEKMEHTKNMSATNKSRAATYIGDQLASMPSLNNFTQACQKDFEQRLSTILINAIKPEVNYFGLLQSKNMIALEDIDQNAITGAVIQSTARAYQLPKPGKLIAAPNGHYKVD